MDCSLRSKQRGIGFGRSRTEEWPATRRRNRRGFFSWLDDYFGVLGLSDCLVSALLPSRRKQDSDCPGTGKIQKCFISAGFMRAILVPAGGQNNANFGSSQPHFPLTASQSPRLFPPGVVLDNWLPHWRRISSSPPGQRMDSDFRPFPFVQALPAVRIDRRAARGRCHTGEPSASYM